VADEVGMIESSSGSWGESGWEWTTKMPTSLAGLQVDEVPGRGPAFEEGEVVGVNGRHRRSVSVAALDDVGVGVASVLVAFRAGEELLAQRTFERCGRRTGSGVSHPDSRQVSVTSDAARRAGRTRRAGPVVWR
jgi:hypothetical protein